MKRIVGYSMVMFCFALNSCTNKQADTAAIKAVIEKETATWRAGDIKAHAACWQIRPYTRILVSTEDGISLDIPPSLIINPTPDIMGDSSISVNSNYTIALQNNTAWSTHNQTTTATNGTTFYSYEMRMLEKINCQWKIVGESVHHYKPK